MNGTTNLALNPIRERLSEDDSERLRRSSQEDGTSSRSNDSVKNQLNTDWEQLTDAQGNQISASDLVLERMIGQGKFSEVFLCSYAGYSEKMAVKIIHTSNANSWREVQHLQTARHAHIIKMYNIILHDGKIHIVMELCPGGSLFGLLHSREVSCSWLSWPQKMRMCIDVASAMEYLHCLSPPILHRDLKSLNILLVRPLKNEMELPIVKVADLGLARTWTRMSQEREEANSKEISSTSSYERMTMQVGTLQWMAPEVHIRPDYTEKVDVYSFAMVVYEVAWQRVPFCDEFNNLVKSFSLDTLLLGQRPDVSKMPDGCPEELLALIKVCWDVNPARRPQFMKVHPWLKAVSAEKGYDQWTVSL